MLREVTGQGLLPRQEIRNSSLHASAVAKPSVLREQALGPAGAEAFDQPQDPHGPVALGHLRAARYAIDSPSFVNAAGRGGSARGSADLR